MILIDIPSKHEEMINPKEKSHCWLRSVHLFVSFLLPLAIIVYTIMYNHISTKIAEKNREQDLLIAEQRYDQDFEVAYQRYEQDVHLANEKQEQEVLAEYLDALARLLRTYGMHLNRTQEGRPIARYKTLAALEQLKSPKRKSILIRSLIESNLTSIEGDGIYRNPSISIWTADLTGISIRPDIYRMGMLLRCLDMGYTNLTNSSFQKTDISGSMFNDCRMLNSDFSLTVATVRLCSNEQTFGVIFALATLRMSNFSYSIYHQADFRDASLHRAEMLHFACSGCTFTGAKLELADLSFATLNSDTLPQQVSNFSLANTVLTRFYHANLDGVLFNRANMTHANATRASFINCTFEHGILKGMSFEESTVNDSTFVAADLTRSIWKSAKVINSSFFEATMSNVLFTHAECHSCLFAGANLTAVNFTNTSLLWSDFTNAIVTLDQLTRARSLKGIVFPNGTLNE